MAGSRPKDDEWGHKKNADSYTILQIALQHTYFVTEKLWTAFAKPMLRYSLSITTLYFNIYYRM
jgi:hypothetical protein